MSTVVDEFAAWLADFLPNDYYENYRRYRWDLACGVTTSGPRSRPGGCSRPGPASTAVDRWACAMRWRSGSRPRCGRHPSCPTFAGPGVAAPGIRQFGTAEQIDRLLVPLLRGDEWWALGMSEPEAGSDFAGLRTRAVRDGDVFRVNGHKIWTTQAHESRWCTLYARTDPDAPKHRGISCLILDLNRPG